MSTASQKTTSNDYDIPASQAILIDNIYALLVTQYAQSLREKDKDASSRSENYFIDLAHKMVMKTKRRIFEIKLMEDKYFSGVLK